MTYRKRSNVLVLAPTIALLAILWGLIAVWARTEKAETIDSHFAVLRQINSAVSEHTDGLLKLTEMALNAAGQQLMAGEQTAESPEIIALGKDLLSKTNGLVELVIIDRYGRLNFVRPEQTTQRISVVDRDYYSAQMDGKYRGLFIGTPIISRYDKEWLVPITMVPSRAKDGSFAAAALRVRSLADLHNRQRMQAGGAIGIFRADGVVITRAPFEERFMTMTAANDEKFNNIWLKQPYGHYVTDSKINDGKIRLITFTKNSSYPIFIYMSTQLEHVLKPWYERVKLAVIVAMAFSLLAIVAAIYLIQSLKRSTESHQRFVDVLDTASDLVWEVDQWMRFRFISNRYRQVLGLEMGQIIGATADELGWRPIDKEAEHSFALAIERREPFTDVKFRHVAPDTGRTIVSVSGRPFYKGEKFGGYRGVTTDITERLERETERQLQAERKAQGCKLEALGQLAGGIAHDFNNLLGAILGFAHFLVEDSAPGSPQHRYAERIVMAGQRGRGLVQQILTFSRRTPGAPEDIVVAEVIHETVDLLGATLPSTTTLIVEDDGGPTIVTADRSQLGQVVVNLCINASDALETRAGEIRISVGALDSSRQELKRLPVCVAKPTPPTQSSWTDEDGCDWIATGGLTAQNNVSIRIADTGTGIPHNHFAPLFDLFFTTKANGGGTGLGLPVVQRVVTEHGGAILVKTKVGYGTVFEIILPQATPYLMEAALPPGAVELSDHRSATILVIDDDESFCEMVQTALRRFGHEVVSVGNALEGLAAIQEDPPLWDMVVTDQTMPHMKGDELVRRIKAIRPSIRCIICTGYSVSLTEADAFAAGADGFCMKPLDLVDFGNLVSRTLNAD